MLTANRNLLRSTPDLSCFPSTARIMPNSSGSALHRSRSSRSSRTSSGKSLSREHSSRSGSRKSATSAATTTTTATVPTSISITRDTLSAHTTPVRRSGSVRHNRSQSFRNVRARSPQPTNRRGVTRDAEGFHGRVSTVSELGGFRNIQKLTRIVRTDTDDTEFASAATVAAAYDPAFNDDEECYLLRIFNITPKGSIVNQGDYVKQRPRRRKRRSEDFASTSSNGAAAAGLASAHGTLGTTEPATTRRVLLLGSAGVGKTALVTDFLTHEFVNAYDMQDDDAEKCVSVLLDGDEIELLFIDQAISSKTDSDSSPDEYDAYVITYSVTDRQTFEKAVDILFGLKEQNVTTSKAVILVGNKSDLARSREVSNHEGKAIASSYECKFIETSALINHNVDELLVGIVSQIRLKSDCKFDRKKNKTLKVTSSPLRKWGSTKASLRSSLKSKGIINKILGKGPKKSKSCENLHIL